MRLNISSGCTLAAEKEMAFDAIDNAAGEARARYITVSPGQSETYTAKAENAAAYIAAGYPMPCGATTYPWIAAEAAATGVTPTELADTIASRAGAWASLGAAIEAARMGAKSSVSLQTTNANVIQAKIAGLAALAAL